LGEQQGTLWAVATGVDVDSHNYAIARARQGTQMPVSGSNSGRGAGEVRRRR
jgi:hypothetical protein